MKDDIRVLTTSDEDLAQVGRLWQSIFPDWPIEQHRLERILRAIPGHHFINDNGFSLAFMSDAENGRLAIVGVLPEHRRKGIGTRLVKKTTEALKDAALANGKELKSFELGSFTPRFFAQLLVETPAEVKTFFLNRGFNKSADAGVKDYFKDIRHEIAPPEIMEKAAMTSIVFSPWTPEGYEECMTKQRALFHWARAYETLAAFNQHHEVLVAFDPETNEQIGWTLMCSHSAIVSDVHAFLPLLPSKDKTGLIAAVGVDEGARGKGVGLAMVVKALENMRARGIEGVFIDYVKIRDFYEKFGFEPYWEYESYIL
ncbi:hypothetical protein S7711_02333 [Stachybotrys chartarum IBT 7711]|uniref:N-acetyltransferase domain-containing protein n=1 Tax=Stachybotrys chartarum (strain CBS 109288 / IBT 7711) TaxID=1280523 RepID=A0A084B0Z4_STACB|nr:hypothetical protein S7711_02333 [Stachybotrys chartarum IBT 7711]